MYVSDQSKRGAGPRPKNSVGRGRLQRGCGEATRQKRCSQLRFISDLARKHGISEATLYNWKAKYGGLEVSEAKRLRTLEDENRKLKKLLAESMLDNSALKELLSKKW